MKRLRRASAALLAALVLRAASRRARACSPSTPHAGRRPSRATTSASARSRAHGLWTPPTSCPGDPARACSAPATRWRTAARCSTSGTAAIGSNPEVRQDLPTLRADGAGAAPAPDRRRRRARSSARVAANLLGVLVVTTPAPGAATRTRSTQILDARRAVLPAGDRDRRGERRREAEPRARAAAAAAGQGQARPATRAAATASAAAAAPASRAAATDARVLGVSFLTPLDALFVLAAALPLAALLLTERRAGADPARCSRCRVQAARAVVPVVVALVAARRARRRRGRAAGRRPRSSS